MSKLLHVGGEWLNVDLIERIAYSVEACPDRPQDVAEVFFVGGDRRTFHGENAKAIKQFLDRSHVM